MTRKRDVVYFILAPKAGMVKIGQCCEENPPDNRLKSLQTGCPETLDVLLILDHRAPFEDRQLHKRFDKYRKTGEWFEYRGDLKAFIEEKRLNPAPSREDDLQLKPDPDPFEESFYIKGDRLTEASREFRHLVLGGDPTDDEMQAFVDNR